MISSGPNKVSDCVRGIDIRKSDMDFVKVSSTSFVESTVASQEVYSEITEKISDKIGLQIIQNSYAWKDAPNNKFIIISYQIKNISDNQIDSLHVGIYSDWDILLSEENKSNYNLTTNTGFVYSTGADPLHAGVSLLSNQAPLCYSLDHGFREADNNINPNDGNFTTYNKYRTLSNGIFRPIAGIANSMGGDVSQVVGGSIYNFDQNKTEKFTFAIIAGDNLNDLLNSAKYAKIQSDKLNLISASDDILNTTIDLNIYPNPFNSTFKVSTNSSNTIQNITIQNIFGKEILYYKTPSTTSFSLNLSDEPSGVYVVKTMVNNKIFTNKIIKQ